MSGGPNGLVSLVGAGPGDPELITLRGLRRLQTADAVVYDRLVDPRLLDEAPDWAERILAGKGPGWGADQRAIERLLIDLAWAGKRVVRLKGGDPFVFGRGGEELLALVAAGVPVEIVPGVSSAMAVPALAGIPVTHRGLSSAVTIVTAHEDPAKPDANVDWDWLAAGSGTLVVLMGLARLGAVRDRLIAGGRPATTPAALIASGSLPDELVIIDDLAGLPDAAERAGVRSPALIVVGEVARVPKLLGRTAEPGDPVSALAALSLELAGSS